MALYTSPNAWSDLLSNGDATFADSGSYVDFTIHQLSRTAQLRLLAFLESATMPVDATRLIKILRARTSDTD